MTSSWTLVERSRCEVASLNGPDRRRTVPSILVGDAMPRVSRGSAGGRCARSKTSCFVRMVPSGSPRAAEWGGGHGDRTVGHAVRGREVRYFGGSGPGGDVSGRDSRKRLGRTHSDFDTPPETQGRVTIRLSPQNPLITAKAKNCSMKDYVKFFVVTQIKYMSMMPWPLNERSTCCQCTRILWRMNINGQIHEAP